MKLFYQDLLIPLKGPVKINRIYNLLIDDFKFVKLYIIFDNGLNKCSLLEIDLHS